MDPYAYLFNMYEIQDLDFIHDPKDKSDALDSFLQNVITPPGNLRLLSPYVLNANICLSCGLKSEKVLL